MKLKRFLSSYYLSPISGELLSSPPPSVSNHKKTSLPWLAPLYLPLNITCLSPLLLHPAPASHPHPSLT